MTSAVSVKFWFAIVPSPALIPNGRSFRAEGKGRSRKRKEQMAKRRATQQQEWEGCRLSGKGRIPRKNKLEEHRRNQNPKQHMQIREAQDD